MAKYENVVLKAADLKLGDVVKVFEGPWNTASVTKVTKDDVTFHRPYGTTVDFATGTDTLIAYTGLEVFSVSRSSGGTYLVYDRKEVK